MNTKYHIESPDKPVLETERCDFTEQITFPPEPPGKCRFMSELMRHITHKDNSGIMSPDDDFFSVIEPGTIRLEFFLFSEPDREPAKASMDTHSHKHFGHSPLNNMQFTFWINNII